MSILHHTKIVTRDPDAVNKFLTEALGMPAGWRFSMNPSDTDSTQGPLTWDRVMHIRGASGPHGYVTGDTKTRQFQILGGETSRIWATAIATRELEQAHEVCRALGHEVTEMRVTPFASSKVNAFFASVGGIVFEVMRVE